jgi:hypothetical protein
MCGNGCISRDGGFQAMLAASGGNLQIRTLLIIKKVFYRVNSGTFGRSGGKHPFGWWKIEKKKEKKMNI